MRERDSDMFESSQATLRRDEKTKGKVKSGLILLKY